MPYKQPRYSQRTVNLGLQKTLLDVATSIKQLQKNNNPNVALQKALDFLKKIAPLLLIIGFSVACLTGLAYFLKSMM